MRRFLCILAAAILLPFCARAAAPELHGRVLLQDSALHEADYVMVFAKEFGVGTISDEHGVYSLSIPAAPGRKVSLEYSRMGYATVTSTVTLEAGSTQLEDVVMSLQTLMLAAAYVTPDGKDPADVVLEKLWAHSREVHNHPFDYLAYIDYSVATHELPLVSEAMPKLPMSALKLVGATQGFGPLIRYCTKNDDFKAKVSLTRSVKGGTRTDFSKKLLSSDQPLPAGVKQSVMNLMDVIDLFEILYGDTASMADKWSRKHKFHLSGTYEYGDKLVDVLKHTDHWGRSTITLHVVEEDWSILKLQLFTREGEVLRCEARQIQNGVYMPLGMVMKPAVTMIRAGQIPALIEEVRKSKDFNKATKERMIKALEAHEGEDFNPYIAVTGNVRYGSVGK